VIDIRSIVGLVAAALVATAAYAEPTAAPKAQAPEPAPKPAKAAKSTSAQTAPRSADINLKRDAKQAWSEMRRTPRAIKEGVPAAGREARDQFKSGWNKAKEGFTGSAPPTVPKPVE